MLLVLITAETVHQCGEKKQPGSFYCTETQLEAEAQCPRSPMETGICERQDTSGKLLILWYNQIMLVCDEVGLAILNGINVAVKDIK